jgi:hypothetical protein
MVLVNSEDNQDLDMEWVALLMSARSKGFSTEDVRKIFLCLQESGKEGIEGTAV